MFSEGVLAYFGLAFALTGASMITDKNRTEKVVGAVLLAIAGGIGKSFVNFV
jgi:hypothetical protein